MDLARSLWRERLKRIRSRRAWLVGMFAIAAVLVALALRGSPIRQLRGVDLHPMASDADPALLSRELHLLEAAGIRVVRFDVFWHAVEWSGPGIYDPRAVAQVDSIFSAMRSHGIKVILDLWSTPCWASSAPLPGSKRCAPGWWNTAVPRYPPHTPANYGRFAAFAVRRWGRQLAALELWNEPNGSFLLGTDKAAAYARLVHAAYASVKAIAPRLPVIMSLSGTDTSFLRELYAAGVKGSYDGIAVHPYSDPRLVGLKRFRAFQLLNNDSRPLWVTEVGWPSSVVGLRVQADDVSTELRRLAQLSYVADVEIYDLRDGGTSEDPEDHFGLVDPNLTPKPAWYRFVSTLHGL